MLRKVLNSSASGRARYIRVRFVSILGIYIWNLFSGQRYIGEGKSGFYSNSSAKSLYKQPKVNISPNETLNMKTHDIYLKQVGS